MKSGCNYNILYRQVIESEKKLRVKRILSLAKKNELNQRQIVVDLNAEND